MTIAMLTHVHHSGLTAALKALAAWPRRPRRTVIDIRELPEHILRDIGALDGVDPRGRHR